MWHDEIIVPCAWQHRQHFWTGHLERSLIRAHVHCVAMRLWLGTTRVHSADEWESYFNVVEKSVRRHTDKSSLLPVKRWTISSSFAAPLTTAKSACCGVTNELFSGALATTNHNHVDTAVIKELILYCVVTDHECVLCSATPAPLAFQVLIFWCDSSRRTADVAVWITKTEFEATTSSREQSPSTSQQPTSSSWHLTSSR